MPVVVLDRVRLRRVVELDAHLVHRGPLGQPGLAHQGQAVGGLPGGAEGVGGRQHQAGAAIDVLELAGAGQDRGHVGGHVEGGVTVYLVLDLRAVGVAQRQAVDRAHVQAGGPADAGVRAADFGEAVVLLRAVRAGHRVGHEAQLLGGRVGAQRAAEIDRVGQGHVRTLDHQAEAGGHALMQLHRGGQGQVDHLHVGLDRVVAADPVGVVLGGQAKRHADHGTQGQVLQVAGERQDEGHGRNRGQVAGVAAVAALERLLQRAARGGVAAAFEFKGQVDGGDVELEGLLVEGRHQRRVVGNRRSVTGGRCRTGHRAALGLDAVLAQLECRAVGRTGRRDAGNGQRQGGNNQLMGMGVHALSKWIHFFDAPRTDRPPRPCLQPPVRVQRRRGTIPYPGVWSVGKKTQ